MRKLAFVLLLPIGLYAQEYMGTFSLDTAYEFSYGRGFQGPVQTQPIEELRGYRKKGTNQIDILTTFYVKVGSITLPISPAGNSLGNIYFTQTFLDNDPGWEFIASFYDSLNQRAQFKVFNETGQVLVSDSGYAMYSFDGQNTYIYSEIFNVLPRTYKLWKFRSNVFSSSQPLSKTVSTPGPMMTYMPSGDLRVHLQPVAGGTSIQIFDMLGRQVFNEKIQNITRPTTFTIPSSGMPNSPFVAKVNNTNGSFVKKGMPVR